MFGKSSRTTYRSGEGHEASKYSCEKPHGCPEIPPLRIGQVIFESEPAVAQAGYRDAVLLQAAAECEPLICKDGQEVKDQLRGITCQEGGGASGREREVGERMTPPKHRRTN